MSTARATARLILTGLALATTTATAQGATIPVTTTLDSAITGTTNDGLCSLREAVVSATLDTGVQGCPAGSGADDVVLPAGTFTLTADGFTDQQGFAGDLDVTGTTVRVVGAGAGATVIQVDVEDRAFDVFPAGTLTLEGLTVRGAELPARTGARGAAVRNQGRLTVIRAAFENNIAALGDAGNGEGGEGGDGGAIWSGNVSTAAMSVIDSTFTNNRAGTGGDGGTDAGDGGAIGIETGTLAVTGSTFAGNQGGFGRGGSGPVGGGGGNGGAIAVSGGTATIQSSTFTGNSGGPGGQGEDARNTTGGSGGAVWVSGGQALISWSTFLGNVRGLASIGANGISGAIVGGSILADPEPRCGGVVASAPNLLSSPDGACLPGSAIGDPRLGLLAANGGPTLTLLPGPGSAAINTAAAGCPATDQRGLPRPALGACDFGALEIQPGTAEAVGAPGVPGVGTGAPVLRLITALKVGPAAFRATGKRPRGTAVSFRLNTAGTVVLTVRRPAAGKRSRDRCVAPTRRLRTARKCTRQVLLRGKVTRQGTVGLNTFRFSGTLRNRALAPGRYTLVVTLPRLGGALPVVATKRFRILPSS